MKPGNRNVLAYLAVLFFGLIGISQAFQVQEGELIFRRLITFESGHRSKVGSSSAFQSPVGVLCVNTTAAATTGTIEQVLATCSVPANALDVNGKVLRVTAWGTTANNANSKTARVRYGLGGQGLSGSLVGQAVITTALQHWNMVGYIVRTGAATQIEHSRSNRGVQGGTATELNIQGTSAVVLSSASDIVVTGETPTAAGDFTFGGMIVEVLN